MSYETRLLIGHATSRVEIEFEEDELIIDSGVPYRPFKRDKHGNCIKTERLLSWFKVLVSINLGAIDGALDSLDRENTDSHTCWYWYEGREKYREDEYGVKLKPVPSHDVLTALKPLANYKLCAYAIVLLEKMRDDNLFVLVKGY